MEGAHFRPRGARAQKEGALTSQSVAERENLPAVDLDIRGTAAPMRFALPTVGGARDRRRGVARNRRGHVPMTPCVEGDRVR